MRDDVTTESGDIGLDARDAATNPWLIRLGQLAVGIALVAFWEFASGRLCLLYTSPSPRD